MPSYSLSVSDLLLDDDFNLAAKQGDESVVGEILYKYGMDTSKPYELSESKHHRTIQGTVEFCPRYEGEERTDPTWVKSPYATMEAIIESSGDPTLRFELRSMGAGDMWEAQSNKLREG